MSTTLPPPSDDEDLSLNELEAHKERTIQPLGKMVANRDLNIPGADEDLLEELRRKTAALAEEIGGKKPTKQKTLDLKTGAEPISKDVIDALEQEVEEDKKALSKNHIEPAHELPPVNPAAAIVRDKLARIYKNEPDAAEEAIESYNAGNHRTKHQQFMYNLTTSGKSLAEIQTEWHAYYLELPDHEKHQVWQEFYAAQSTIGEKKELKIDQVSEAEESVARVPKPPETPHKNTRQKQRTHPLRKPADPRTAGEIKHQILDTVSARGKLTAVHHAKSLLFGLGLSALAVFFMSFVFFNETYIAPFVSPGRTVSATPIIGDQNSPVSLEPKIIIPKINLEVPVVFDLGSIQEDDIQNALEDGVVHFASSPNPGEVGNSVIVGHSSNNILNSGKYKFAFVLLKQLEAEDTFFVQRDGVRYTYKVYKKEIVPPNDISVLQTQDRPNTMTLITCDPPGTSINRLIITAEQISPDPSSNTASTALDLTGSEEASLPSNAPSLWSRLWPF